MKLFMRACIALLCTANALMAWTNFSGSFPYDDGFEFPSGYDDDGGQGYNDPWNKTVQPPTSKKAEPITPMSFEQKYPNLIVMFTKDQCPYCRYMKPIMEQAEMKHGQDIKFLYVDVVENPQYASQYGFSTVPQIMYYKDGQRMEVHGSGDKTITLEQVEAKIKKHFGELSSSSSSQD